MKEKSHIDEMRAAVRGDIERARARRESDAEPPEPEQTPEPRDDAAPPPGKLTSFFRRR